MGQAAATVSPPPPPESPCSNNPRYEKFLTQHLDNPKSSVRGRYCNSLMWRRGLTSPECKEKNTFIHGSKREIRAVCDEGGVPDGHLRRSQKPFQVTTCTLMGGSTRPPCEYRENTSPRNIVIACENSCPVHYEKGLIVTPNRSREGELYSLGQQLCHSQARDVSRRS